MDALGPKDTGDSFVNHFGDVAGHYAASRPGYPSALFDYLNAVANGHAVAWDCGAGSGQASISLANFFDTVIATDASPEQISCATPHPNVAYRVAPAEESGIAAGSVDLILVAQALHWFDLPRFYAEATRVLVPKGILAAVSYGPLFVEDPEINSLIQTFYHDWVGPFWPPERRHVENGYRDISFPFKPIPAPSISMRADWSVSQLLGYLNSWSATSAYTKANGENPVTKLVPLLGDIAGVNEHEIVVRWPLTIIAGYVPD